MVYNLSKIRRTLMKTLKNYVECGESYMFEIDCLSVCQGEEISPPTISRGYHMFCEILDASNTFREFR